MLLSLSGVCRDRNQNNLWLLKVLLVVSSFLPFFFLPSLFFLLFHSFPSSFDSLPSRTTNHPSSSFSNTKWYKISVYERGRVQIERKFGVERERERKKNGGKERKRRKKNGKQENKLGHKEQEQRRMICWAREKSFLSPSLLSPCLLLILSLFSSVSLCFSLEIVNVLVSLVAFAMVSKWAWKPPLAIIQGFFPSSFPPFFDNLTVAPSINPFSFLSSTHWLTSAPLIPSAITYFSTSSLPLTHFFFLSLHSFILGGDQIMKRKNE